MTENPVRLDSVDILFPQPLVQFRFADADAFNARLMDEIAARRRIEPGRQRSNRGGGWHSDYDLFRRREPAHAELAARIAAAVEGATARLAPDALREGVDRRLEGWVSVNGPGGYNSPHHHHRCFWSGTYYVQVPQGEGGEIEFLSPMNALVGERVSSAPMVRDKLTLAPTPGLLILFPSNIKHWVHPHSAAGERVTVAFNATFVPGAKAG